MPLTSILILVQRSYLSQVTTWHSVQKVRVLFNSKLLWPGPCRWLWHHCCVLYSV